MTLFLFKLWRLPIDLEAQRGEKVLWRSPGVFKNSCETQTVSCLIPQAPDRILPLRNFEMENYFCSFK